VEHCLASLERHPPSGDFEVLVVDNASSDGTPERIAERFASVRLLINKDNTGYSRGVNQGIRSSSGRLLLIINPDIVLQEGSIDRIVEFIDRTPDAGIAGSKLVYPDGRLQYSCRRFYSFKVLLLRRTFLGRIFPNVRILREHLMMDYDHMTPRQVDWVLGACMLVRREAIERVGSMDERFFLYFEDIDWCYRMKNHGWSIYYVPESVMVHSYERSSAKSVFRRPFIIHLLSMLRYVEKWNKIFYFLRRHRAAIKTLVFALSDLIMINASFIAAYYARMALQPLFRYGLYPMDWYSNFILFYNLIYFVIFFFSDLYRLRRETPPLEEFLGIAKAVILGVAILMASTYLARVRIYSRAVVLGQALIIVIAVHTFRQMLRAFHRELIKANFDLKRVLLVGTKGEVEELSERLMSDARLGIEVVGSIGDSPDSIGAFGDIAAVVERFKVQEVIVLPSFQSSETLLPILALSRKRMIQVRIITPLARFLGTRSRIDEYAGFSLFSIEQGVVHLFWKGLKRALDVCVAVLVLPISVVAAALCYLYGKITGRVRFYNERRCGAAGRTIDLVRVVDRSGRDVGDLFKIGLFLKVIIGEMSLVGPPSLPESACREGGVAGPGSSVYRPGITGAWRLLPDKPFAVAFQDELISLQNRSFIREFSILIRSLKFAFTGTYPPWFDQKGNML
jgi:GT2 family glycosyltransferase/lipopolysaccharide/colanic/teichoic acid biosynthesis glycosyltransferase/preprotein translocase subunit Sss1